MNEFPDDDIPFQPTKVMPIEPSSISAILRIAVESRVPVDTIERLVALHERMSDRSAAAEFNAAHASFQDECPSIPKTSRAKITSSGGGYEYKFAELDQIAKVTRPFLRKHGLSYSWDSKNEAGTITVTCTLRHIGGHSESSQFSCPTKPLTTSMSAQQEVAAALTYARRQSLIQVLGLTTCDPDSDAAAMAKITSEQAEEVENSLAALSDEDRAWVLHYMRVQSAAEIGVRDLKRATAAIKAKVAEAAKVKK